MTKGTMNEYCCGIAKKNLSTIKLSNIHLGRIFFHTDSHFMFLEMCSTKQKWKVLMKIQSMRTTMAVPWKKKIRRILVTIGFRLHLYIPISHLDVMNSQPFLSYVLFSSFPLLFGYIFFSVYTQALLFVAVQWYLRWHFPYKRKKIGKTVEKIMMKKKYMWIISI